LRNLNTSSESTYLIFDVIRKITGNTDCASFTGTVSATVNGILKIDQEKIPILLTNSRPNCVLIDIMWEDGGYKNYKDMGLFGRMSTQWQQVKKSGTRAFTILSDTYVIEVAY